MLIFLYMYVYQWAPTPLGSSVGGQASRDPEVPGRWKNPDVYTYKVWSSKMGSRSSSFAEATDERVTLQQQLAQVEAHAARV